MMWIHMRCILLASVALILSTRLHTGDAEQLCEGESLHDLYIGALLSSEFNSTNKPTIRSQIKADFAYRLGLSGHKTLYSLKIKIRRSKSSGKTLVVLRLFNASPNLRLLKKFVVNNFITRSATGIPKELDFTYDTVKLHRTRKSALKEQEGYILETCKLGIRPFCLYREDCVDTDTNHVCELCDRGTYLNSKKDICVPCDEGETTPINGATEKSLCVDECDVGSQHNLVDQTCAPCPYGYTRSASDPYCLWNSDTKAPNRLIDIRVPATLVTMGGRCLSTGIGRNPVGVSLYIPLIDNGYFQGYKAALCMDPNERVCFSLGFSDDETGAACTPDCKVKEGCQRFRSDIVVHAINVRERSIDMESEFNRSTVDILKDYLFGYQYIYKTLETNPSVAGIVEMKEEPTVRIISDSDYKKRIVILRALFGNVGSTFAEITLYYKILNSVFYAGIKFQYLGEFNITNKAGRQSDVEVQMFFQDAVDVDRLNALADIVTQSAEPAGEPIYLNAVLEQSSEGGASVTVCRVGDKLLRCSSDVDCASETDTTAKCTSPS